jgi:hypothetical protein
MGHFFAGQNTAQVWTARVKMRIIVARLADKSKHLLGKMIFLCR